MHVTYFIQIQPKYDLVIYFITAQMYSCIQFLLTLSNLNEQFEKMCTIYTYVTAFTCFPDS